MKKPRLTLPQWFLLTELSDGCVRPTGSQWVTVRALRRLGLAVLFGSAAPSDLRYEITEKGRAVIKTGELQ